MPFLPQKITFGDFPHGSFLKWWYPQNTPKWSFLVEKPMVVGYHHFRNPPHICEEFASTPKLARLCSCCKKSQGANLGVCTAVRLTVVKPSKYGEIVGPEIPGEHLFTYILGGSNNAIARSIWGDFPLIFECLFRLVMTHDSCIPMGPMSGIFAYIKINQM